MRAAARRSDIVISGPVSDSEAIRLTGWVISELIHDCQESLLIVSFAAFGVTGGTRTRPGRAAGRADRPGPGDHGRGGWRLARAGRGGRRLPGHPAGCDVLDLARRPAAGIGASRAALHAKLVAADQRVALLGSANLTDKALALNLELGVIIRDPEVVRRMVRHFRSLMQPGNGVLQSLPRQHMDPAM